MQHEQKDINTAIAEKMAERIESVDGYFTMAVELDENTQVDVCGYVRIEGEHDVEYYTGTGAWTTTEATVSISDITVSAYDEDGNEITLNEQPDAYRIEEMLEAHLRAA